MFNIKTSDFNAEKKTGYQKRGLRTMRQALNFLFPHLVKADGSDALRSQNGDSLEIVTGSVEALGEQSDEQKAAQDLLDKAVDLKLSEAAIADLKKIIGNTAPVVTNYKAEAVIVNGQRTGWKLVEIKSKR